MAENAAMLAKNSPPAPQDIFDAFRRNVDHLFDDFAGGFGAWPTLKLSPRVDVTDTDGVIEISAELPGMEEKDVEVSLEDGMLMISGEKKATTEKKEKNYVYAERSYGSFLRRIPMPPGVEAKSVNATMNKGVLTVKVAKPSAAQAKKIEVKSA